MQSNNIYSNKKNFRTNNPYNIYNPVIYHIHDLSLYEQKLNYALKILKFKFKKEIAKESQKCLEKKEEIFSNEVSIQIRLKIDKLEQNQRQHFENETSKIFHNILSSHIENKQTIVSKLLSEALKKENAGLAKLQKQFQKDFQNLLSKEEKTRKNIIVESETFFELKSNDKLKDLISKTKSYLESFTKNNKNKINNPELFINIYNLCHVFENLISNITKYKSFSTLTICDIYLLQKVNWHILHFGKRIIDITKNFNIVKLSYLSFFNEAIQSKLDSIILSILNKFKIENKIHNKLKLQINALAWLEATYLLQDKLLPDNSKEKSRPESLKSLFESIEKFYIQNSTREINRLSEVITDHIFSFIQILSITAEKKLNIENYTCDDYWKYILTAGLELCFSNNTPINKFKELLSKTCILDVPFAFNIYLEKAHSLNINLNERFSIAKLNILHLACKFGQERIVALLFANNVDINIESEEKLTGFHYACIFGHQKVVQLFVDKDVNINDFVKKTTPIVFKVIEQGKISVLQEILKFKNLSLNKFDVYNADTPLMFAIHMKQTNMAKLLIEHGADTTLKNAKGVSAYHF